MYSNCYCCPPSKSQLCSYCHRSAGKACCIGTPRSRPSCLKATPNSQLSGTYQADFHKGKKGGKNDGRNSSKFVGDSSFNSFNGVNANTSQLHKKNSDSNAYGSGPMDVIEEETESTETITPDTNSDSDHSQRLEESCAAFLNIMHDNVVETVKESVERLMGDYFVYMMERVDCLCGQMLRNEGMVNKMYEELVDKINQQNELSTKQFRCLCSLVGESYSQPLSTTTLLKSSSEQTSEEVLNVIKRELSTSEIGQYIPMEKLLNMETKKAATVTNTCCDNYSFDKQPMSANAVALACCAAMMEACGNGRREQRMPQSKSECNTAGTHRTNAEFLKRFRSVKTGPSYSEIHTTFQSNMQRL